MSDLKTNLEEILQEKQTKIIPENIKKDVTIFDVTGTYEGANLSNNINVFMQETEPELKNGIWLQNNNTYDKVIVDKEASDSGIIIGDKLSNFPVDTRASSISVLAGNNIYIFSTGRENHSYKYNIIDDTFSRIADVDEVLDDGMQYSGIYFPEDDIIYFAYSTAITTYDIKTDSYVRYSLSGTSGNGTPYSNFARYGRNIYSFYNSSQNILKINVDDKTVSAISFPYAADRIVATIPDELNNCVYLIHTNNKLLKFDLTTEVLTEVETLTGYDFSTNIINNISRTDVNLMLPQIVNNKIYHVTPTDNTNKTYMIIEISLIDYTVTTYDNVNNIDNIQYEDSLLRRYMFKYDDVFYYVNCVDGGNNYFVPISITNKTYENNSIVILPGTKYNTKLFNYPSNVSGDNLDYFTDVWYYNNGYINNIPTYYGNGTEWVKIKN